LVSLGLLATTSKLMWRHQENLLIQLYSHDTPPRIIAVVAHNEATQEVRNVAHHAFGLQHHAFGLQAHFFSAQI
jgi:hypothetical protein